MLGNRPFKTIILSLFQKQHWFALYNMFRKYKKFPQNFYRYISGAGNYPYQCQVKTTTGIISIHLYTHHDLLTVNEIFCRLDYKSNKDVKTIVDLGSNIGISALYFLTRNSHSNCYLFEPDPKNIDRLKHNLSDYNARYHLYENAVATTSGEVQFGVEKTGRYGGIGVETGNYISVSCLNIKDVLNDILSKEKQIDILKVDTEGSEIITIESINRDYLKKIKCIYLEGYPKEHIHPELFTIYQYGSICQMKNKYL